MIPHLERLAAPLRLDPFYHLWEQHDHIPALVHDGRVARTAVDLAWEGVARLLKGSGVEG